MNRIAEINKLFSQKEKKKKYLLMLLISENHSEKLSFKENTAIKF